MKIIKVKIRVLIKHSTMEPFQENNLVFVNIVEVRKIFLSPSRMLEDRKNLQYLIKVKKIKETEKINK